MTVDISCDNHVHTEHCRHATGTMEEYVKAAIDKGLRRLVFMEHLEEGIAYPSRTWLTEAEFDDYFQEGNRLKTTYGKQIEIGLGVEAGYNPACVDRIVERLRRRAWECIGLSYHFVKIPAQRYHLNLLSRKVFNLDVIQQVGPASLLGHYFDTLVEAVQRIPAHVVCHLDAGLRHYPGLVYAPEHWDSIERLLHEMKRAGLALEINTSGYPVRQTPFPAPEIIARARECGLAFTAGSDAHRPDDVGRCFERLPPLFSSGILP